MDDARKNPKNEFGVSKAALSSIPAPVLFELGLAMQEGAAKYGRHNYRAVPVRGSVYYDAALRHIMSWWEGENEDPDSGLSHITKAIASLAVLRDAMIQNKFEDDRPPRTHDGWIDALNAHARSLNEQHPKPKAPFTEITNPRE